VQILRLLEVNFIAMCDVHTMAPKAFKQGRPINTLFDLLASTKRHLSLISLLPLTKSN